MKIYFLVFTSFLLFSCGNSDGNGSDSTKLEESNEKMTDLSACILSYQTKYDQLLPLSAIQKHYKGDMSKAEKKYDSQPEAKIHDTDNCEYVWDSKRIQKMKLMGREMEFPSPNRIGIKWIGSSLFTIMGKATPLESFKAFYRNTTAKEKEVAFQKAGEVMKKKGYDEKTTKTASSMGKELSSGDNITFKSIEGIGEAASWRIKDKILTVLVGKITFDITSEVSENDEENIELAKKLALEVLSKCK